MQTLRAITFSVLVAGFAPLGFAEDEIDVGRTAAGQIKILAGFPQPLVLDPSIFPGIAGYAFAEPAFHATILDLPAEDFYQLSPASSLEFILLAKDPGIEVWNDTGSGFLPVGGAFYIGVPIFDTHPVWNITSGVPGTIYSMTIKVHDVNGVYSDSEPQVLDFTPGQIVVNPANGHYYERIPVLPGTGVDWDTANGNALARAFRGVQGHLATITSSSEQSFISTHLGGSINGFWLGGYQQPGAIEPAGGWGWVTGEPWDYTHWLFSEPDDARSYRGLNTNEDRLIVWDGLGDWNDAASVLADPSDTRGYIVEFDLDPCSTFVPADFDRDCDVDAADFAMFRACATGPGVPSDPQDLPVGCVFTPDGAGRIAPDLNQDGSVDMNDFAVFQRCLSGSNRVGQVNCAG